MRPAYKGVMLGKRFTVYRRVTDGMEGANGLCRKHGDRFVISIRPGLKPDVELEIALHEMLHAADWSKDEEWVEDAARDIARALRALGL